MVVDGDHTFLNVPSNHTHEEGAMRYSTRSQFHHDTNLENEAFKALVACHNELVTAIANDHLNIAGHLLAQGYISDEVFAKTLLSSTPNEKATLLVTAVREKIKIAPQLLPKLVKLFSESNSTKCITNFLQSAKQGEQYVKMCHLSMIVFHPSLCLYRIC